MKRRIAVTGLGVLSPAGSGKVKFWQAITRGEQGIGEIQAFDTSVFTVSRGGEVTDLDPAALLQVIDPSGISRTSRLAAAAARMAADDARLEDAGYPAERLGVCIGTTMGNHTILEQQHDEELSGVMPDERLGAHYPYSCISSAVSEELGCEGPSFLIPTACAAGNYAIAWGKELIEDGILDAAIVGGSDALSRTCFAMFHRLGAIAPERCRPFDLDREGMMVSEGAAALILEDLDRARERGAVIYAELLGYGLSCDASHATAPHPEGLGAMLAMNRAMEDAGVEPADISYISAHGTGTRANDSTESAAVRRTFGPLAETLPVSSIKSMLGHTMGAASAIEAVACALAVHHGVIPPTMNVETPDPDCVPNTVAGSAQSMPVSVAMSNAFAFGGNISTILLGGASE
ncbi:MULTISPECIES: beta-ketoacyl-[acyl-carrier-protein] synthase family protein [Paenibacillus]|uniref:beta-ketoacyl-[acyl-carrier-protein] synthase family protein n=1 Tax=Paenibacillus TaxID=44249 RepID=UPI0022B88744|nr:beta-ketoacyl-[acyl-carrier-protein] synthase family protein [Paenibacillus caseinilyticus]MCZ8519454.1 beta-ketoacyl-[acyl-carrier-protein] synthase family protein [Paenibacillus caseinilyticus]